MKAAGTPTGRCAYDWKDGNDWLLACVTHKANHTIARMRWAGYDTLRELLREGRLTGAALEEARFEFDEEEGR